MPRKPVLYSSAVAAAPILALSGCQSYRPAPLNLRAHSAAWAARDPASPDVAGYARRLASAATAQADVAFDTADGLSLREAEVVALFFNPRLRAARLKARAAAVGAAEAGRWEDPVLQIDAERIIQAVENPWVVGGLLNLTLPLSGRLALENDRAVAEADVARVNALLDEQRVLAELDAAWAELAVLDQRTELTRSFLQDLDSIVGQAEKLRAAGELNPLEAGLFRVERVRRSAKLRSLGPHRREQELAVKALMGLTPESPLWLIPSLPQPVDPARARINSSRSRRCGVLSWVSRRPQPLRLDLWSRNSCSMVIRRPYKAQSWWAVPVRSVIRNQHSSRLGGRPGFHRTTTLCSTAPSAR